MMGFEPRCFRLGTPRPGPNPRTGLDVQELESRLVPANVTTYHNDLASTGQNLAETQLTRANVNATTFGKLFAVSVDGQVFAQPLVMQGVNVTAGANPGAHDVVFVATQHDSIYAIDANATDGNGNGAVLWHRSLLDTGLPGATSVTSVPAADIGAGEIEIGITGTPVIDANTNTLYVVARTKEVVNGVDHYVQRLFALNLADGSNRADPFVIGDTTDKNTNATPIFVNGTGDGAVNGRVEFNARWENQRGALALVNGVVYVSWASFGDNGPYHGWVVGFDAQTLALKGVFNTTPNGAGAGIWQAGGALSADAQGHLYFETGNGTFDGNNGNEGNDPQPANAVTGLDANGFPVNGNYGSSFVKIGLDPTTTADHQNLNGWGLKALDYFTPFNQAYLNERDLDVGSSAATLLPDEAGSAAHPHLLIGSSKEGTIYVLDRDNLGKFGTTDNVVQEIRKVLNGALDTAAYYNRTIYFVEGYGGNAKAFAVADGRLSDAPVSLSPDRFSFAGSTPSVSANGDRDGIVWDVDRGTNQLRAYSSDSYAVELWNSDQAPGGRDKLGAAVKFQVPTVANGKVFVAAGTGNPNNFLVAYGLLAQPTAAPAAPADLTATAVSGGQINLAWTTQETAPNTADAYQIEQSTDGTAWAPVATASRVTSYAVGGLNPQTTYQFRLRAVNAVGTSDPSNVATATTTEQGQRVDYSGGFATGTAGALTLNNGATVVNGRLRLTDGGTNEARSVFTTSPIDVTKFTTTFTFQISAGEYTGDGFTFVVQGNTPRAVGSVGGSLGYANDGTSAFPAMDKSLAVKFDLYGGPGASPTTTGVYAGGAAPMDPADDLAGKVDLHSGHVMTATVAYDGKDLTVTLTDTETGGTFTQTYHGYDVPALVGGAQGYVGFTAGTGGGTATQEILTWVYTPTGQPPDVPQNVSAAVTGYTATTTEAVPLGATITWGAVAGADHYTIERKGDADGNYVVVGTTPAGVTAFKDTSLASRTTYHYRIQAGNAAGEGAASADVSVTTPALAPTPTDGHATQVTPTSITLTWTNQADNADGYEIIRRVNGGPFQQVAKLPAATAPAPGPMTYTDTGLEPGNTYDYHVKAYNLAGYSDFTGTTAVTTTLAPTDVAATAGPAGPITLAWTPVKGAVAYNVYRGLTPGGATTQVGRGVTDAAFTDTDVTGGTAYYYVVTAVNAGGESDRSVEVTATAAAPLPVLEPPTKFANLPGAPTGLRASLPTNVGQGQVVLTWSPVAGAVGYTVYRSLSGDGAGGTPLATGVTGTTFTDTTADFGTTYFYRVAAVTADGEGERSNAAAATPLLTAHVNFTTAQGAAVAGYLKDTGAAYGARANGLTYGWSLDNSAAARDRNSPRSPDELRDSFVAMQTRGNPNAAWEIAVPNGTYRVHLVAGDAVLDPSLYRIAVEGTLALRGISLQNTRWFENTVTVVVTDGKLTVGSAVGAMNNKIDAIDVTQVLPGAGFAAGAAGQAGLQLNGSAAIRTGALRLTDTAGTFEAGSAFTANRVNVGKFTTTFDVRLTNAQADGMAFVLQGNGPTALGAPGGSLGYSYDPVTGSGVTNGVALKLDLYDNLGEGGNSTGVYVNGAAPAGPGGMDLTGTGINLHSGHVFRVTAAYDGVTLAWTITDRTTGARVTRTQQVDIAAAVGGGTAYAGFTGGTGGLTAQQDVLSWQFTPLA